MAATVKVKRFTSELLERIEGDPGNRYEIIDGVLYEMPAPNSEHALAIINLIATWLPLVRALGGKILVAPLDVFVAEGNPVQPDVIVLLPDRLHLLTLRGIDGPPNLVIEVLSPSNPEHDRLTKRALYARGGVPEYWLVDPEAAAIEVLVLNGGVYRTQVRAAGDELVTSPLLPGFSFPASAAFV